MDSQGGGKGFWGPIFFMNRPDNPSWSFLKKTMAFPIHWTQSIHCEEVLMVIQNISAAGAMLVTTTGEHSGWFGLSLTERG